MRATVNRANMIALLAVAVIVSLLLPGCALVNSGASLSTQAVPVATPSLVRPGIYTAQHIDELPLPTDGYQVYIVGEQHGIAEVHQLFADYLERLYATGLRDVILEESQGYEQDANEFLLGETDTLISGLCLRADVLRAIRDFNDELAPDERVRVHLVDLDYTPAAVHTHLLDIRHSLGEAAQHVDIPPVEEFQQWDEREMASLAQRLAGAAEGASPRILQELATVKDSIRYWIPFIGGEAPSEPSPETMAIREVRITENIQTLLSDLQGRSVLALYGAGHAQKTVDNPLVGRPWAQRLSEDGVDVYSLFAIGMSGTGFWRGKTYSAAWKPEMFLFLPPDGVSLEVVLRESPDYSIVYIDPQEASNLILPGGERANIYDGLVLFREIMPMADACP